jgi:hypothetical protein
MLSIIADASEKWAGTHIPSGPGYDKFAISKQKPLAYFAKIPRG